MEATLAPYVVTCAELTVALAARPEVAAVWEAESACAGMSVGGLTQHLLSQVRLLDELLGADPSGDGPITLEQHYERAAWAHTDLDSETNVGIREVSDERAGVGQAALLEAARDQLARLPERLAATREPDTVHLPWQGWSLRTGDFVVTRCMEMLVHGDDLAASVGVPTPEYPLPVVRPVLTLLTDVAVRRHGQTAVVRAFSRPQRAPAHVSAF
ncbi:hypothetical protein EKO23_08350 [Nocardioides guangzhouensis]|uniref:Mycothiol-dependent maleylpyruvate isomerase metal-binding domain-containing protein n=1 Tax=Nocardioides guangzhouensis TaxID=2497878 RepID=A0A4Q4ZEY6_9ACTN|nr:maleylpyruvate isomerase N-terminal domain-containing protein [Nocardioides guangzhouensis]RYP86672.1 hypothetical protein EKO23_08350 [Nocardioides guangzhouensis]